MEQGTVEKTLKDFAAPANDLNDVFKHSDDFTGPLSASKKFFSYIPSTKRPYIITAGAFLGAAISIAKILLTAAPFVMIPGLNLLWSAIVTSAALAVIGGLLGYGLCKFFAKKESEKEYSAIRSDSASIGEKNDVADQSSLNEESVDSKSQSNIINRRHSFDVSSKSQPDTTKRKVSL